MCFSLSSPDLLTQDLPLSFVVQVRVPAPAPAEPRGHFLVCRCTDPGKEFPGAPRGAARIPSPPTLAGLGSGSGPSRPPAQVTEGLNIPEMRLQTGMKRSV